MGFGTKTAPSTQLWLFKKHQHETPGHPTIGIHIGGVLSTVCGLLLVVFSQTAFAESKGRSAKLQTRSVIGRPVPDFVLPQASGQQTALSDFNKSSALVVVFMGTECPIGNAYVPVLADLYGRYRDQGVSFIAINSNLSDDEKTVAAHIKEFKVPFPVLIDNDQTVADLFSARRTPEAFLLDRRRQIRYRGRIDDRFGYDFKREKASRHDLENGIREMLAGKKIAVAETDPLGCLITRKDRVQGRGKITYAKQVSRILQDRCADCHHPETSAPFSLLTFEDARNRAAMIRETVVQRRMPPWSADPRHGKFANDLRMTTAEIDTLVAWIDNGTPKGDEKDLPQPREYAKGWLLGKPDIVFTMPREYTVPAAGTVEYQYFVTPTNFEKDVWVQASEARPGNWDAVHHIIVFVRQKNGKRKQGLPAVGGFAPGEEPMVLPANVGFKIPAGSELVWQLHYTPTGKIEKDVSKLGLYLCKEQPKRRSRGGGAINFAFRIPPGAERHRVVAQARIRRNVELISLMPHMHLRGRDFKYTARYPDGSSEVLLSVPNYDFNWQHRYRLAKPLSLPAGTTLECVAHFDNSIHNPANPDPTREVRWGDQSWEEMMIGWYNYVVVSGEDADDKSAPQPQRNDIWTAAGEGDLEAIRRRLAAGRDINAKEPAGGSSPILVAALFGRTQAVQLLIERKADINLVNNDGSTPLHAAAFCGHIETVERLILNKANLNTKNKRGKTPLDTVADEWNPQIEGIYKFIGRLLQVEFDLKAIKTARPKIAALLRKHGALRGDELPEKESSETSID